jgi:hypothetical protein
MGNLVRGWGPAAILLLAVSLGVRLFALGWGLPAGDPAVLTQSEYRTSYHLDEDNYLWGLMQMDPAAGSFDVHDYHWGTLQFYLVYGALRGGEAAGVLPAPWQNAFQAGTPDALSRIYLLGRLVSVLAGVLSTALVVGLGRLLGSPGAALFGGAAYAIAPLAVVGAHYLTSDVTMSAGVAAAVGAAALAAQRRDPRWLVGAGGLLGLAIAAKYSAVCAAPAVLAGQWACRATVRGSRHPWVGRAAPWLAAGAGFLLGEPYALLAPGRVWQGLQEAGRGAAYDLLTYPTAPLHLLAWHGYYGAALALTPLLAILAAGGLAVLGRRMARRRESAPTRPAAGVVLVAVAGLALADTANGVRMLRYDQPLLPLLAVAAGVGWAALPRPAGRGIAGAGSLATATGVTLGQLALLAGPHPADRLVAWVQAQVPPGATVARAWPEYLLVDPRRYRLLRLDPWQPAPPPGPPPDYVIMDDMQLGPPTKALADLLRQEYQPVITFAAHPQIGPLAWDEGPTPHDWKYSHPAFTVYAHRP